MHYGKVGYKARLSPGIPSGRLTRTIDLEPGRYNIFVQMYQHASPQNEAFGNKSKGGDRNGSVDQCEGSREKESQS